MSSVYVLKLCQMCAQQVLGMVLVKTSSLAEAAKCDFCHKKKAVDVYRVTMDKKGDKPIA